MSSTMHEELVREHVNITAELEPLNARKKEIEKALRDLDYGSYDLAGVTVSIQHNRRLDKAAFAKKYPVIKHPNFYTTAPNSAEIRKALSPNEIDELSTDGEKKVVIK